MTTICLLYKNLIYLYGAYNFSLCNLIVILSYNVFKDLTGLFNDFSLNSHIKLLFLAM